jgi:hypothetical protein
MALDSFPGSTSLFRPQGLLSALGRSPASRGLLTPQKKLGDLLRFLREAFGQGTELSMVFNDLTVAPVPTRSFLGCFV